MRRIIPLFLAWSQVGLAYQGDGKFVDHGPLTAHDRYVLDLGPVPMGKTWRREFSLADLPNEVFVVGLTPITPSLIKRDRVKATVRVSLMNEQNEKIIDESAALEDWVWSATTTETLLIYRRGSKHAAHQGRGTYFKPRPDGRYRLTVEVTDSDPASKEVQLKLVTVGGGWK